ncbi:hypothetical protein CAPTEDRAFT_171507 [Capitella teleta]|uniref:Uncharacterized protein n=1 Tax=Capitella teleta TaxID=283909 RepID=R7USA3_CAPTE|nr:hypothetical protein CAPTEDRAFT_171507 [Capitella teleta]|eukprot:ELU06802.1 hypothetical protein CAPTEDRAFT_171507 [Capitella teleta]
MEFPLLLTVLLAVTVLLPSFVDSAIQCKDQNNQNVDWFIIYKLPKISKSQYPLVREGLGHLYMDVHRQSWTMSNVSLEQRNHAIAYTLQQIYDNYESKDVAYALYNDEAPPDRESSSHGHTKGDLAFDSTSGFWLVHSLPKFPPVANESYAYPETGKLFGQTFLCISLGNQNFNTIGLQLKYTYPFIYDYSLPDVFTKDNPNLSDVLKKHAHVTKAPYKNLVSFQSLAGQEFTSFAKNSAFDADLYSAWLAPYYKSDMNVESWQNGRGKLDSNCTGTFKVCNVCKMIPYGVVFKETKDHSKWAFLLSSQRLCIGGINRMSSQFIRAGGSVCFSIPDVWKTFQASIKLVENCPDSPRISVI